MPSSDTVAADGVERSKTIARAVASNIVPNIAEDTAVGTSAEVHLDEWISPELVDDNGLLRVGRILEWMDVAGGLAAIRYCRRQSVTASVNGVDIFRPVEVGEHVSMTARVVHTSRRSMGLHVSLRARGANESPDSEVMRAYMTFVPVPSATAIDGSTRGHGSEVEPWTPLTPRDRALFREGELRREFRKRMAAGECTSSVDVADPQRARVSLRALVSEMRRISPFHSDRARGGAARSPESSYIHRIEPVMASALNMHGTLYGGTLMRWIEDAASMSARAFTNSAVVVVGVHGLDFLKPVNSNVFAHIHAMAVRADSGSVTIRVEVTSERPTTRSVEQSLCCFFTYRPLDRRAVVPELDVHSDAERALFAESAHHLAFARRLRES